MADVERINENTWVVKTDYGAFTFVRKDSKVYLVADSENVLAFELTPLAADNPDRVIEEQLKRMEVKVWKDPEGNPYYLINLPGVEDEKGIYTMSYLNDKRIDRRKFYRQHIQQEVQKAEIEPTSVPPSPQTSSTSASRREEEPSATLSLYIKPSKDGQHVDEVAVVYSAGGKVYTYRIGPKGSTVKINGARAMEDGRVRVDVTISYGPGLKKEGYLIVGPNGIEGGVTETGKEFNPSNVMYEHGEPSHIANQPSYIPVVENLKLPPDAAGEVEGHMQQQERRITY